MKLLPPKSLSRDLIVIRVVGLLALAVVLSIIGFWPDIYGWYVLNFTDRIDLVIPK